MMEFLLGLVLGVVVGAVAVLVVGYFAEVAAEDDAYSMEQVLRRMKRRGEGP